MSFNGIKEEVAKYYTEKVKTYGATPKGVDWNGEESQELRFKQLLKILPEDSHSFSLLDYGCGYGSMFEFMKNQYPGFQYTGLDISQEMIDRAKNLYTDKNATWVSSEKECGKADYVVASGIFNVKMQTDEAEWRNYIIDTLAKMDNLSSKGFSFNILTSYSDKEYMKDYLYYADPNFFFDHCKRNFSKYVALLHDYPLYEFTILVKKQI